MLLLPTPSKGLCRESHADSDVVSMGSSQGETQDVTAPGSSLRIPELERGKC